MSANKLLVADAAAFCAKQKEVCSEKWPRQVTPGRKEGKAAISYFLRPNWFFTSETHHSSNRLSKGMMFWRQVAQTSPRHNR